MKKVFVLCGAFVFLVGLIYGKKFFVIYKSMNAFSEKNISKSFQTMYKIQPSKKILRGENVYKFKTNLTNLISEFEFENQILNTEEFLNDTFTIVITSKLKSHMMALFFIWFGQQKQKQKTLYP